MVQVDEAGACGLTRSTCAELALSRGWLCCGLRCSLKGR